MKLLSLLYNKMQNGALDLAFLLLVVILYFTFRKKNKDEREIVEVWTPQHSPIPYKDHYAFNFENKGWVRNRQKDLPDYTCYEIWMKQVGYIDKTDYTFRPITNIKGNHGVAFYTKEGFEEWQRTWESKIIK